MVFASLIMTAWMSVSTLNAQFDADKFLKTSMSVGCRGHHPTASMVEEILRYEREAGFPPEVAGITVAAACNESGFHPRARGDWKHHETRQWCSRSQRNSGLCYYTSGGILQLGGWAKKRLRAAGATSRDPRFDWRASVKVWTSHIASQVKRVRRDCPTLARGWDAATEVDVWRAAHRTAVTRPKCIQYRMKAGRQVCVKRAPRCHKIGSRYESPHWEIWQMWRDVMQASKIAHEDIPRARKW